MNARFQSVARTPVNWRYGAIGAGVALTQGLGAFWYSPSGLGSVWARESLLTDAHLAQSEKDLKKNVIINTVADTGLAFLLQYLSDRYFRPTTVLDTFFFATLIGLAHVLPQATHVLWGKGKWSVFAIEHAYNVLGIFIKLLCLKNIPY